MQRDQKDTTQSFECSTQLLRTKVELQGIQQRRIEALAYKTNKTYMVSVSRKKKLQRLERKA